MSITLSLGEKQFSGTPAEIATLCKLLNVQPELVNKPESEINKKNRQKKRHRIIRQQLPLSYCIGDKEVNTRGVKTWYEMFDRILRELYNSNSEKFKAAVTKMNLHVKRFGDPETPSSRVIIHGFFVNTHASSDANMHRVKQIAKMMGINVDFFPFYVEPETV